MQTSRFHDGTIGIWTRTDNNPRLIHTTGGRWECGQFECYRKGANQGSRCRFLSKNYVRPEQSVVRAKLQ